MVRLSLVALASPQLEFTQLAVRATSMATSMDGTAMHLVASRHLYPQASVRPGSPRRWIRGSRELQKGITEGLRLIVPFCRLCGQPHDAFELLDARKPQLLAAGTPPFDSVDAEKATDSINNGPVASGMYSSSLPGVATPPAFGQGGAARGRLFRLTLTHHLQPA
jgi:hypothetical protein